MVYLGLNNLGKESVLVSLAIVLNEKICVTKERLEIYEKLALPDVFTLEADEARLHVIPAKFLTRKFLEAANRRTLSSGILLTGLYHNWADGPYRTSELYGLKVFPYSDHSSHPEIFSFVRNLAPKSVRPIVTNEGTSSGILSGRKDYLESRIDMSVFDELLTKEPVKETNENERFRNIFTSVTTPAKGASRKRPFSSITSPKRVPKGIIYAPTSSSSNTTESPAKPKERILPEVPPSESHPASRQRRSLKAVTFCETPCTVGRICDTTEEKDCPREETVDTSPKNNDKYPLKEKALAIRNVLADSDKSVKDVRKRFPELRETLDDLDKLLTATTSNIARHSTHDTL